MLASGLLRGAGGGLVVPRLIFKEPSYTPRVGRMIAVLVAITTAAATLIGFVVGALVGARLVGELTPATEWPDPIAIVMLPLASGALSAYLVWRVAWRLIRQREDRP